MNKTMDKRVLIVDDDDGILDAVSMVLEQAGYIVDSTDKGTEVFGKISACRPDAILLDMLISGVDGRELCKLLKQQADTKDIPVIMISAHPSARSTILESGAQDFLPKPFESAALLRIIKQYT